MFHPPCQMNQNHEIVAKISKHNISVSDCKCMFAIAASLVNLLAPVSTWLMRAS